MNEKNLQRELLEQRRLLQMEYEAEKAEFTKISEREGIERLVARGNAWLDIILDRTFYNSLNQRVVEIHRPPPDVDEDHNFEYGKPVSFFSLVTGFNGGITPLFTGEVSFVDGDRMVIAIPENADVQSLAATSAAGVMLSFDETSYRAMFDALDYTLRAKGRLGELRDLI